MLGVVIEEAAVFNRRGRGGQDGVTLGCYTPGDVAAEWSAPKRQARDSICAMNHNADDGLGLVREAASVLAGYGSSLGPLAPWHESRDPYSWTVAELLLRRTNRVAASRAFADLTTAYPDWASLAGAEREVVAERVGWAGLRNQRSKQLVRLADAVVEEHGGELPGELEALRALPGVGPYIADAIRLHVLDQPALPVDGGVQRVLRRVMGLPIPSATRGSTPYRDGPVTAARAVIVSGRSAAELRAIHLGLLSISWGVCIKTTPRCGECPLRPHCVVGQRAGGGAVRAV